MTRIIYTSAFNKEMIAGGVRTFYNHVEILNELGYEAYVWQPDGHAAWFESNAPIIHDFSIETIKPDDVLVYHEQLDLLEPLITSGKRFTRLLFCQNQYYMFGRLVPAISFETLGFRDVFCSSQSAKTCIEDIFGVTDVSVIPYFIDSERFTPKPKKMQVAMVTRKLPNQARFISTAFRRKYRDERELPFIEIDNRFEHDVAEILGESAILLALNHRDSFGLVPVEAMSAGCLVVGFHGHGGLDYARPENGLWFGLDDEEAVVHAIYKCVKGLKENAPWTQEMIKAGHDVAAHYNRDATKSALAKYFGGLGILPG